MRLQDELDALKNQKLKTTAPHIVRIRQDAIGELVASRIAEKALHAGEYVPEFRILDPDGNRFSFRGLLARGPAVIVFYRGRWCPYCNVDLRAIQAAAHDLRALGASIIAISQQSAYESRATETTNGLSFPSLVDRGGRVARAFGLRWKLSSELRAAQMECGIDLARLNGEMSWSLTMPARYIVAPSGVIEYADVSPDYTRRGEPSELYPILSHIQARSIH